MVDLALGRQRTRGRRHGGLEVRKVIFIVWVDRVAREGRDFGRIEEYRTNSHGSRNVAFRVNERDGVDGEWSVSNSA